MDRFGLVHSEVDLVLRNVARIYHRQSKFEEAQKVLGVCGLSKNRFFFEIIVC